jgi:hypothetical protein
MPTTGTNKAVGDLLKPYSPEVRNLALATRALVLKVVPNPIEQVDPKSKLIGYGFGAGYKGMICSLMPAKSWVTLGIGWGRELPDPQELLEGSGKVHAHVKLKSAADLENPALEALLNAAVAHWQTVRREKSAKVKS